MTRYSWTIMVAGLLGGALVGCARNEAENAPPAEQRAEGVNTEQRADPAVVGAPAAGSNTVATDASAAANTGQRKVSDGWLSFKVASALYSDTRYEGDKLDVDTQNGVVTLKGMARSQAGKDAATQIAQGIEGAVRVDNQLSVVPEGQEKVVEEKDDALKERINDLLDKDPAYKDYDVNADITAGKVTLKGEVPDPRIAYQIVTAVRSIPGVKMVDSNQIQLKSQD